MTQKRMLNLYNRGTSAEYLDRDSVPTLPGYNHVLREVD